MKDLIDLGNLVFDRLMSDHGEVKESRMLFLYGITTTTEWFIINSNKRLLIDASGVTKNFNDAVIDQLSEQWKNLKLKVDYDRLMKTLTIMRAEFDRPAPRDGDVWEYGNSNGAFRDITFKF